MRNQTRPTSLSRRTITQGLAWTTPAVALAAAAPASAVSQVTGTNNTMQYFTDRFYRSASSLGTCTVDAQGGYLSTQGTATTGSPRNTSNVASADGKLSTTSSVGVWIETANTVSGTAVVNSVTQTFVFSQPIRIVDLASSGARTTGRWRWSKSNDLNGWTYTLSADGKTLTLTYAGPTLLETSTGVNGTGTYLPGYFLNYEFTNTTRTFCPATSKSSFTVKNSITASWTDANGTHTFTKSTTGAIVA